MKIRQIAAFLLAGLCAFAAVAIAEAMPPRSRLMAVLGGGGAPSFLPAALRSNPPDVYVNFETNQAWIRATNTVTTADAVITTSRASPATQFDNAGNLVQCGNNVLCRSDAGYANWESRTNSVANSTAVGAVLGVIGSGGSLPTSSSLRSAGGLTATVVGTGTESGQPYIDLNFAGTASGAVQIQFAPSTANTVVAYGQTWSVSAAAYQTTGASIAGLTNQLYVFTFLGNGSTFVSSYAGSFALPTSGPLGASRTSKAFTLTNQTEATGTFILSFGTLAASSYNFTVRVALPQMENSSLPTGVQSATLNAAGSGFVGASGTMTWSGAGCTSNPVLNVTASAGALTGVTSVQTGGACSPFPASGATTWTPGGALSAGTGASFNLTPQNQAPKAFATTPILTSGVAASRSTESNVLQSFGTFLTSYSGYLKSVPLSPVASQNIQSFLDFNDGTSTNRISWRRASGTANPVTGGAGNIGTTLTVTGSPVWATGATGKMAVAFSNGDSAISFGGTLGTSAAAFAGVPTQVNVGSTIGPSFPSNANNKEIAIWYGQRIPNSALLQAAP